MQFFHMAAFKMNVGLRQRVACVSLCCFKKPGTQAYVYLSSDRGCQEGGRLTGG